MKHVYTLIYFLFISLSSFAQQPPVGLQLYSESATEGLTLFAPQTNNFVYLIDNCGRVVHQWEFRDVANRTAYLQPDGRVIRAGAEYLEIRDWDNELIWSYSATELGHHHDIEPMPNGNILVISYDYYTAAEIESAGRLPGTTDEEFRLDKILEIRPVGSDDIEIVWQWKFFDHLVQDINPDLPNYGVIEENPGRLDVNFDNGESLNFVHVNGIDYNAALDQIIFSARNLSEVFIIDHSTTTEEAATRSGGNSGKGGDFLWRWGNPLVYQQGTAQDQKLFRQHDPKWVLEGYEDEGAISIFNNHSDEFSPKNSHIELVRPSLSESSYALAEGSFLPADFSFSWSGKILEDSLYEDKQSGVLFLENGNFLVCESAKGRVSEISKSGALIWVYKNPSGDVIYQDGEIGFGKNGIFRADRYPLDYLDFSVNLNDDFQTIEAENVLSDECGRFITALEPEPTQPVPFFLSKRTLEFHELPDAYVVYSLSGKVILRESQPQAIRVAVNASPGVYLLQLLTDTQLSTYKILLE